MQIEARQLAKAMFCPTNPQYPEVILKFFANDGLLSSRTKCIGTGLIFYLFGIFAAYFSGTLNDYLLDYSHLLVSLLIGMCFYLVINLCKKIDPTIDELDKVTRHSERKEFERFAEKWKNDFPSWYYLCLITGITVALVQNFFPALWTIWPKWLFNALDQPLMRLYSTLWGICVNSLIAVGFNRMTYYTFFVNAYCRDFILRAPARLDFLLTDLADSLKALGRLAVKASLAASLPIVLEAGNFLRYLSEHGKISNWHCFGLLAYVGALVFVLLFPLRHAHDAILNGKQDAEETIKKEIEKTQEEISGDSKGFLLMNDILLVRKRIRDMNTWPLDLGLYSKFIATVVLPLAGGAILQIIFERALSL